MKPPVALVLAALLATSCGDPFDASGEGRGDAHHGARSAEGDLLVFAAASLTEAFGRIGEVFERDHPGVSVTFNFGPSDGLATQILEGAPADVFASASPRWMDAVEQDGPGMTGRANFARNRLVVLVPPENPAGIESIADLAGVGVKLALAAEDVPVGQYAREALARAGVLDAALANLVSNQEDVKAVVQTVVLGEADAGIVYVTDATGDVADQVEAIDIPDDVHVVATYPIGVVGGAPEPRMAEEFVDLVLGPGQAILAEHGFLAAT